MPNFRNYRFRIRERVRFRGTVRINLNLEPSALVQNTDW